MIQITGILHQAYSKSASSIYLISFQLIQRNLIQSHDCTCVTDIFDVKYKCEIYASHITLFGVTMLKTVASQCENAAKTNHLPVNL